ncbi:LVIVD repeat-containing protein [Hwangdonia sp.]|uniref:LVIVD repeat-containing protein n=1 Tax=Hwangdonia sp. TaxID=1883432 RepID=UPI003AB79818
MKLKFLLLSLIFFGMMSCDKDNIEYEFVKVATPELMSKTAFRNSVKAETPIEIKEAGKIYAYSNFIFINEVNKGIHVLDNTDPKNPVAKTFINIPGNVDIAVKDNHLFADSSIDLVVFDISDINNITKTTTLEDMFLPMPNYDFPEGVQAVSYMDYDANEHIIVGWSAVLERREVGKHPGYYGPYFDLANSNFAPSAESNTGTGGSLARFQIVNNYLYTVGESKMKTFNISNLSQPAFENAINAGINIETMFYADNHLYLGSTRGMYIYSLANPSLPEYVSEFVHWESCDPVVVDGDYAYVTLRGGNLCGQQESVLEVIDISDKTQPTLAARYGLENPYGLGIKGHMLFVCDGTAGLKLFDKSDPLNIEMAKSFNDIHATDVIPLENTLIMIGGETLYQYAYGSNNDVTLISTYSLN